VSGKAELFYKDEDGNEIQITSGGILNSLNLAGNQTVAGVKTFSSQPSLPAGLTAAAALISTLADGTAPLTVASATKVTNLNADKVDGKDIDSIFGSWASKSNNTSGLYRFKQPPYNQKGCLFCLYRISLTFYYLSCKKGRLLQSSRGFRGKWMGLLAAYRSVM
jgi:hypothetical protein